MRCSARVILRGCGPGARRSCSAGVAALALAAADRLLRLPPARGLFRHRHLGDRRGDAPAGRPVEGAWRRHRHHPAARGDVAIIWGVELDRRRCSACATPRRATAWPTGWRWRWPSRPSAASTRCCAAAAGWPWPPCATMSRPPARSASMPARIKWIVFLTAAFGTGLVGRADLPAEGAHLARRAPSASPTGRPMSSSSS